MSIIEKIKQNAGMSDLRLTFIFLTVPFLLALCERRQDCYDSKQSCEKDWNSSDCAPRSENACRYVGRSYSQFYRGGNGGGSSNSSIGHISRGGFGSIGHAFGGSSS
jgi:hypothetical protein